MPVLKNTRHERFAQNVAKGMSATEAYEKAGYKRNDGSAGRLHRNAQVKERIAELQNRAAACFAVLLGRGFRGLNQGHLLFQRPPGLADEGAVPPSDIRSFAASRSAGCSAR